MKKVNRRTFLAGTAGVVAAAAGCRSAMVTTPKPTTPPTASSKPTASSDYTFEEIDGAFKQLPSTQPGVERWNFQRVEPAEFKGDLLNPHIGTATFQRFNGDALNKDDSWDDVHGPTTFASSDGHRKAVAHYPDCTISYCRWIWRFIEPQRGEYRWDFVEGALRAATEHGQTLQVRMEPFAGSLKVPDWYWATGAARGVKPTDPDHNDPHYIELWGNLIRSFGKHFDGHPALESFDIGYGGFCGEGGGNATPETAVKLTDIYLDALPTTQLVAMMGTPGSIYAMKLRRPIGWRADCFGDMGPSWNHMHEFLPRVLVETHAEDQWKIAPVTMETCYTVGKWVKWNFDLDFIFEQGLKYHTSVFMPKSCYIPESAWDKFIAFNRKLGYRFVLRQFELPQIVNAGDKTRFAVWIDNVGAAPIYRPYKLALRFTQGNVSKTVCFAQDIRKWLPENNHWFVEHLEIPREIQPGFTQIDMAIIDDAGQPKVKLSNDGIGADGWHRMCSLEIRSA